MWCRLLHRTRRDGEVRALPVRRLERFASRAPSADPQARSGSADAARAWSEIERDSTTSRAGVG
ncbi:hypothetical protein IM53_000595 [Xanthomonas phaseoli pv. dieffenbachiae]|uniref:Uncharacterized protein n=1 Tax=Xanthomonas phaseoli pv. dieffenbachiae TaxID=92828 RepID=A0A1V9HB07_9XANT|nr:hypothetical protein IM53_000595 [Xanthomonas phaseoli pv. dieffenbachiae]